MANPVLLCTKNPSFKVSYTTKKKKIKKINKRKTYSLCFKRPRCKRRYTLTLSSGRGALFG